jgi:hypothetical protein
MAQNHSAPTTVARKKPFTKIAAIASAGILVIGVAASTSMASYTEWEYAKFNAGVHFSEANFNLQITNLHDKNVTEKGDSGIENAEKELGGKGSPAFENQWSDTVRWAGDDTDNETTHEQNGPIDATIVKDANQGSEDNYPGKAVDIAWDGVGYANAWTGQVGFRIDPKLNAYDSLLDFSIEDRFGSNTPKDATVTDAALLPYLRYCVSNSDMSCSTQGLKVLSQAEINNTAGNPPAGDDYTSIGFDQLLRAGDENGFDVHFKIWIDDSAPLNVVQDKTAQLRVRGSGEAVKIGTPDRNDGSGVEPDALGFDNRLYVSLDDEK